MATLCIFCPMLLLQGSVVIRKPVRRVVKYREDGAPVERDKLEELVMYCDIISDAFWEMHGQMLDMTF